MTGKNRNWHRAWTRLPDGRLRHESGIEFEFDEELGWSTVDASLVAFHDAETARGVPVHDLAARLIRLAREAAAWRDS